MTVFRPLPTQKRILEVLDYNARTGVFRWKRRKGIGPGVGAINALLAGKEAGLVDKTGYRSIKIDEVKYAAHRLAFKLLHGIDPLCMIDHIDGNRLNNSALNIRAATFVQNSCNRKKQKTNVSGYKGVSWNEEHGRWSARICHERTEHFLGYHDTPQAAAQAYAKASAAFHQQFGRLA